MGSKSAFHKRFGGVPQVVRDKLKSRLKTIGIPELDQDHQKLLDAILDYCQLVERLGSSPPGQEAWQSIERTLDYLGHYTTTHFQREERLMQQQRFPEMEKHREEHLCLLRQFRDLREELNANRKPSHFVDLEFFLLHWFLSHTSRTDIKLRALAPHK